MTEIATNQGPLIQTSGGETGFWFIFHSFNWLQLILVLKVATKTSRVFYFCPGCSRCPASCLRTRTWRSPCMTTTYWAEMRKWARRSSIWRTDSCLASGRAAGCLRLTVCKYPLLQCNIYSAVDTSHKIDQGRLRWCVSQSQSYNFLAARGSISGETSWSLLRSCRTWPEWEASLLLA